MAVKEVNGRRYDRIPVRTHVIVKGEDIARIVDEYTKDIRQPQDIIVVSEKATAASQGRAIPIESIRPGFWAKLLVRFVTKTEYGIGLGMAETLQMAIQECGLPRILFAAAIGGFSKIVLRRRGVFYKIAGERARAIDGPTHYTIPPYNRCVVLAPLRPDRVAAAIKRLTGHDAAIIDANDLGQNIMGVSSALLRSMPLQQILCDNPLGQSTEQTPIGIIREIL